MKHILESKMLRKLLILSCLVFGLAFITFSSGTQSMAAAPCCSSCPGFDNPGEEIDYCSDQCNGDTSGSCCTNCLRDVHTCYRICYSGC